MHNNIDSSVLDYLKSLTLLCVEDNKTTQLLYDAIFEGLVKKIIFVKNGEDGYQKFYDEDINIIITDYDMPVLNGIDMIKKIRDVDKDIPIILVSAIQDIDVIVQALQLNVNNFIKKPIVAIEVMQAIENVSKLLIANNYIKEQREKRIREFEKKEKYNSYQEDLAFSKELNILRNDFYYQMHQNSSATLIDFFYKPLDVLSGDAYSAREITKDIQLFFIIDGMGKGLSASLSSMLFTAYVNHVIDKMKDNFILENLIESALEYMKPILLEDETISADFIVIDYKSAIMHYCKFSMPSSLLQSTFKEIIYIKSNNPPISKYIKTFEVSKMDIEQITKFLFYSDGIIENSIRNRQTLYADYIKDDFLSSFTKDELREKILWKIDTQEDDMTFIFINRLRLNDSIKKISKTFDSSLDAIDEANEWYSDIWTGMTQNFKLAYNAGVVFSELFMNAYEHGSLGLDAETKHKLLNDNSYFAKLEEMQKRCRKKITVDINVQKHDSSRYIATTITDEGTGFDTQILSRIFRDKKNFNGRGVYISRQSSLGLYYNSKGNSVLFLHKIEDEV
ncbi:MAG: two-component system, HptB-dependent secretion and biofilm response regulator [Campylobacterota bacterium]|nr:two-component system, HptB-dependent secretion and biofilm response regulator [Campylobacterota bacterium]